MISDFESFCRWFKMIMIVVMVVLCKALTFYPS